MKSWIKVNIGLYRRKSDDQMFKSQAMFLVFFHNLSIRNYCNVDLKDDTKSNKYALDQGFSIYVYNQTSTRGRLLSCHQKRPQRVWR
jgi:hypothetical protein